MGFRTAYGNTVSENGWPMVDTESCEWVDIPGCNPPVHIQVQKGQPAQILRAFMADWNAYIEPLHDADTACWTATNDVGNSCHLSGSAVDGNWAIHKFHVSNDGFDPVKRKAMDELLDFYTYEGQKIIYWGQWWGEQGIGPFDCMHVELAPGTYKNPKTQDFIDCKIRPNGLSTYKRGGPVTDTAVLASAVRPTSEKVLTYNHSQQVVAQEKFFDCCPASTQIVLDGLGVHMSEDELIRAIGTNENGTNTVEQALPILNQKTAGKYVACWLPQDPPRPDQVEALWHNVKSSIDAGFGCVLNFQVPSSNFPRGTRGSASPQYRGGVVYHYVACMGWADDGPGGRHLWIADPGFPPFDKGGYWMALEQVATAIPPHGYAYATATGAVAQALPPKAAPVTQSGPRTGFASVSPYRSPGEPAVGGVERFVINDDGMLHLIFVEYSAMILGDRESIARVVRAAAGHGAETAPEFITRARRVLNKVPSDDLTAVLSRVQILNPQWLESLRSSRVT